MIPIVFEWSGDFMVPLSRFRLACDKQFVVGETYQLIEHEERSQASHAHFFACLQEGWRNLPEDMAERFPTVEALRKWCLIKCGYADVRSMVYETVKDAKTASSFIGMYSEHSVIVQKDRVVSVYTAKSQSVRAMDKAAFQASKTAVLDLVASMIGVTTQELAKQVGVTVAEKPQASEAPETARGEPQRSDASQAALAKETRQAKPARGKKANPAVIASGKGLSNPEKPEFAPKENRKEAMSSGPDSGSIDSEMQPQPSQPMVGAENTDKFPEPWIRQSPESYVVYAVGWMGKATSSKAVNDRWKDERKIRSNLALSLDTNQLDHLQKVRTDTEKRLGDA